MSYRGRIQSWCVQGHYTIYPEPYNDGSFYEERLCRCGAKFVFNNCVDDTNCDAYDYIEPKLVTPAVECTCSCCGNVHISEFAIYEIPKK